MLLNKWTAKKSQSVSGIAYYALRFIHNVFTVVQNSFVDTDHNSGAFRIRIPFTMAINQDLLLQPLHMCTGALVEILRVKDAFKTKFLFLFSVIFKHIVNCIVL